MFKRRGNGVAEGSGREAAQGTGAEDSTQQAAATEPAGRRSADPEFEVPWKAKACARAFAALCGVIVLVSQQGAIFGGEKLTLIWPPDLRAWTDWVLQLHWVVALLVISPFLIVTIVLLDLHALRPSRRRYTLVAREPSMAGIPEAHAQEDRALWEKRKIAIEASWEFEKDRILRLQCRMVLQAVIFGNVTTFALMCAALAAFAWHPDDSAFGLACSAAAAAAASFLFGFGRIMLRISGGDVTARAFSWAIRSVALVVIADLGLYVLLRAEIANDVTHAMLLGVFVGATGDHAIEFLLDKAAKSFGTGAGDAHKTSPLLDIEGMTSVHVDRLEEEGIVSIHDLAFAPTARLFFSTAYSLQQICNWQDRALLLVYVGKKAADALAQQMHIRGAIDLRAFAHDILYGGGRAQVDQLRETLCKVLDVGPCGLDAVLESMAHDEVTMRIRYYWGAVIAPERFVSQLEPPARAPSRQASEVTSPPAAVVAASQIVVPPGPLTVLRPAAQAAAPAADAVAPGPNGKLQPAPQEPAPSAVEGGG